MRSFRDSRRFVVLAGGVDGSSASATRARLGKDIQCEYDLTHSLTLFVTVRAPTSLFFLTMAKSVRHPTIVLHRALID